MVYREMTSLYNERRFGKPWIAKLDFSSGGKPNYRFGKWLGQPGRDGELSIEVVPGDVIATGQRDYRMGVSGASRIGVVQLDGSVKWWFALAEARDAGRAIRESSTRRLAGD
jgi:hypothetical protein